MPYQMGVANDQHDLIDKLRLFLIENGWTVNLYADDASSYRTFNNSSSTQGKRLHVSRNGRFLNFRTATRATVYSSFNDYGSVSVDGITQYYSQFTGIAFYRSTGFDAAKSWDNQPGNTSWSPDITKTMGAGCRVIGAVPSYRFFLLNDPFLLFVAIEYEVGKFRHMLMCDLQKYGDFVGGELHAGPTPMGEPNRSQGWDGVPLGPNYTASSGYGYHCAIRAVGLGQNGADWCRSYASPSDNNLRTLPIQDASESTLLGSGDFDFAMLACMPSNYTGIVPLVPLRLARNVADGECQLLGEVPGLKVTRSGYKAGDIITMGADRWMVVPLQATPVSSPAVHFAVPYDGV
ncbi:hypothetical protein [Nitratidesulfovibrio vulgaris]|uniref:Uncharacterized protein n=1 Tax=Nitratidesulfovibrio vulgaris (strain DP4) TaxID=391774 RepID=A0A0H3A7U0_NITV4|nr:hypothetical protein [Nitratidesulfovibrio vulgaris]ABM28098.1 hypothetical protein Dvul_1078 [Nitratidesulfovibrio vulgaris DP4]